MTAPQAERPLVSLITYCFNGERFIRTYFEALLAQTYTEVEIFFYNNGSADKTGDIAEEYRQRLEEKFRRVTIEHYKDNQVTVSLKNKALAELNGKYFCGVDSDDIMSPNHVEKMVEYLETNPQTDLAFCQLHILNEKTKQHTGIMKVVQRQTEKEHFLDCLLSRNMIYTPIGYMIRTEAFRTANHGMQIHETRYGENYQLLLPLLYEKKPGLMEDVLGEYLVRGDSYTANLANRKKRLEAVAQQGITISETLRRMQIPDESYYRHISDKRICGDCLDIAIGTKDRELMKTHYQKAKRAGALTLKRRAKYLLACLQGER